MDINSIQSQLAGQLYGASYSSQLNSASTSQTSSTTQQQELQEIETLKQKFLEDGYFEITQLSLDCNYTLYIRKNGFKQVKVLVEANESLNDMSVAIPLPVGDPDEIVEFTMPIPFVLKNIVMDKTKVNLSWTGPVHQGFLLNTIYRDTKPNVTLSSTEIGAITSPTAKTYQDTIPDKNIPCYYRIFSTIYISQLEAFIRVGSNTQHTPFQQWQYVGQPDFMPSALYTIICL